MAQVKGAFTGRVAGQSISPQLQVLFTCSISTQQLYILPQSAFPLQC